MPRCGCSSSAPRSSSGLVVAALVEEVRTVARRDGLTGLWNRRALEEDLERLLATAAREPFDVTFAILDIDHFKRCNDSVGHHGADDILMHLAAAWSAELRPSDSLARFGGDEFAIVFPRSTEAEAVAVLERLRDAAPAPDHVLRRRHRVAAGRGRGRLRGPRPTRCSTRPSATAGTGSSPPTSPPTRSDRPPKARIPSR